MMSGKLGRVVTEATIANLEDIWAVERGLRRPEEARSVQVANAVVDTGATFLSVPKRLINQLGLEKTGSIREGSVAVGMYQAVRLTIQDRTCTMDVLGVQDDVPVVIGQIPLCHLDFVIDPLSRTLTGNPAHGGEHVYEMY